MALLIRVDGPRARPSPVGEPQPGEGSLASLAQGLARSADVKDQDEVIASRARGRSSDILVYSSAR